MRANCPFIALVVLSIAFSAVFTNAQSVRKSVPAAEVNGTYRKYFTGKYKGSINEIKMLATGRGRVRIAMDLIYPYTMPNGDLIANVGQLDITGTINADMAELFVTDIRTCRIAIRFVRAGTIKVTQEGTPAACGFGNNVTADGIYRKVSNKKPRFNQT